MTYLSAIVKNLQTLAMQREVDVTDNHEVHDHGTRFRRCTESS